MRQKPLNSQIRNTLPGKFIELECGITHYDLSQLKNSDTVILVHGFFTPFYIWDLTYEALVKAGFNVLRFDLLGRGYSDRPRATYTLYLFVGQLSQLITALAIRNPLHLVGLSYGGWIVTEFANHFPGEVGSLTLIDPLVSERPLKKKIFNIPVISDLYFSLYFSPVVLPSTQIDDFFDKNGHPEWEDKFRDQMRYKGFDYAILSTYRHTHEVDWRSNYEEFAKLGIPIKIIWGTEDQAISRHEIDLLRKIVPDHEFLEVENAGHIPHYEKPDFVSKEIIKFLR